MLREMILRKVMCNKMKKIAKRDDFKKGDVKQNDKDAKRDDIK